MEKKEEVNLISRLEAAEQLLKIMWSDSEQQKVGYKGPGSWSHERKTLDKCDRLSHEIDDLRRYAISVYNEVEKQKRALTLVGAIVGFSTCVCLFYFFTFIS